jgi:hypothetical protein
VLLDRPAELAGEDLVELGARQGAVALTRLGDGQPCSEVIADVLADAFGLVRHTLAEQAPSERGGERLLVRCPAVSSWSTSYKGPASLSC